MSSADALSVEAKRVWTKYKWPLTAPCACPKPVHDPAFDAWDARDYAPNPPPHAQIQHRLTCDAYIYRRTLEGTEQALQKLTRSRDCKWSRWSELAQQ